MGPPGRGAATMRTLQPARRMQGHPPAIRTGHMLLDIRSRRVGGGRRPLRNANPIPTVRARQKASVLDGCPICRPRPRHGTAIARQGSLHVARPQRVTAVEASRPAAECLSTVEPVYCLLTVRTADAELAAAARPAMVLLCGPGDLASALRTGHYPIIGVSDPTDCLAPRKEPPAHFLRQAVIRDTRQPARVQPANEFLLDPWCPLRLWSRRLAAQGSGLHWVLFLSHTLHHMLRSVWSIPCPFVSRFHIHHPPIRRQNQFIAESSTQSASVSGNRLRFSGIWLYIK